MAYFGKYDSPESLANDDKLSYTEKVELLEQWLQDKEAYIRASEEGMPGEDRSELLQQINGALISLKNNANTQDD